MSALSGGVVHEAKSAFKSKTLWVNVVACALPAVLDAIGVQVSAQTQVGILTAANIVLRFLTKNAVRLFR